MNYQKRVKRETSLLVKQDISAFQVRLFYSSQSEWTTIQIRRLRVVPGRTALWRFGWNGQRVADCWSSKKFRKYAPIAFLELLERLTDYGL